VGCAHTVGDHEFDVSARDGRKPSHSVDAPIAHRKFHHSTMRMAYQQPDGWDNTSPCAQLTFARAGTTGAQRDSRFSTHHLPGTGNQP
jgi:hypothetical protein